MTEQQLLRAFYAARDRLDASEAHRLAILLTDISDDYQACLDEADDMLDEHNEYGTRP